MSSDDVAPGPDTGERPGLRWVRRLAPWVITGAVVTAILVKYPIGRIVEEMHKGNALGMVPVALGATLLIWFTATTGDFLLLRSLAARPVPYRFLLKSKAGLSMLNALGMALNYGGFAIWIHRVLGCGKVTVAARNGSEDLRRQFTQQVLDRRIETPSHTNSGGGPLMICRTSIGMFIGLPPCPGAADASAAISYARAGDSTSTIQ